MLPRRFLVPFLSICLLAVSGLAVAQSLQPPQGLPQYVPDHVLVKFTAGASASAVGEAHRQAGGNPIKTISGIGVQVVQVTTGTVPMAVAAYEKNPNVEYAEPDYYRVLVVPDEDPENPSIPGGTNLFVEQWYLDNWGQPTQVNSVCIAPGICFPAYGTDTGVPDADINAPEAWDITIGLPSVKIAVLDSGVDCNTLELSPKCTGVRNDYINYGTAQYIATDEGCGGGPPNPACDKLGHGTHVASLCCAETSNEEGIAGVGWETEIGVFKVCYKAVYQGQEVGLCPVSNSALAIADAVTTGHNVITMSYGSDTDDVTPTDPSNAECDAIEAAVDAGVSVVAAAGNNGGKPNETTRVYPAACTHSVSGESTVIAVAASDRDDNQAWFTTYSTPADHWVSIAAPGDDILGVLPNWVCGFNDNNPPDTCGAWFDGTSMAAPLVAGAASLVWADLYTTGVDGGGEPAPSACFVGGVPCNQVVRQRLEDNADENGAGGQNFLDWTQHGRLNVAAALLGGGGPVCGDGVKEGTEVCDGTDVGSESCVSQGFPGGTLVCNGACSAFDTSGCDPAGPVCGDGVKEGTEVCDGTDVGSESCVSQGFAGGGTLACNGACSAFDTSACDAGGGPVCGDGVREDPEVCDGTDLAGETCLSQGFAGGGTLACNGACSAFDTSQCDVCNNNGTCDVGENCESCPGDCLGVQSGKPSGRYCCGNTVCESPSEDGVSCAIDCGGLPPGPPPECSAVGESCTTHGDCCPGSKCKGGGGGKTCQ